MKYRTLGDIIFDWINYIVLFVLAATMFLPFLYMFAISFSSFKSYVLSDGIMLWPKEWSLEAYKYILSSHPFVRSIWVTIIYTVTGTTLHTALCAMFAYALTRGILGQKLYIYLLIGSFLIGSALIPSYLIVKATHLMNTIWAIIIPGAITPWTVILFRQFFLGVPSEITEAAVIDGANELTIFRRIILPLSKPALAAFSLFTAVQYWNSFFSAILYINDSKWWPLQVILRQLVVVENTAAALGADFSQTAAVTEMVPPETIGLAAILITILPILIVYPLLQKHFTKGVVLGAIKG